MSIPAALIAALSFSACTSDGVTIVDDELAVESARDGEAGKADGVDTFTFYRLQRDYRKCSYPMCGGFYVSRVNRALTRCEDGTWQDRCYVAAVDLAPAGLSESDVQPLWQHGEGSLLVRGAVRVVDGSLGGFATLVATEVWQGRADGTFEGTVTRVIDSGIRCVTTPCPSLREDKLNSTLSAPLADLYFGWTTATEEEVAAAYEAIFDGTGLLVSGYRYYVKGQGGWGNGRAITQFLTKVEPQAASGECYVGGCSSQLCTDYPGAISTCEWRPEYACYQQATCERQPTGDCGWTPTPELDSCLANPEI